MTPAAKRECAAQQREFIHEMLGFVRHYTEMAQNCVVIGDDAGANYAIEKMAVHAREALKAKIELAEYKLEAS